MPDENLNFLKTVTLEGKKYYTVNDGRLWCVDTFKPNEVKEQVRQKNYKYLHTGEVMCEKCQFLSLDGDWIDVPEIGHKSNLRVNYFKGAVIQDNMRIRKEIK